MADKNIRFFMGANTAFGFHSLFDELHTDNKQTFILKGGPGTGKSFGMKRLAREIQDKKVEHIYCSSDTNSLDAVIFPSYGSCVADGTAPHVCEPIYPGVMEHIVPLGSCWDSEKLKRQADEIIKLGKNKKEFYKQGYTFLRCAYTFLQDNMSLALNSLDKEKAENYIKRFSGKNFKPILGKKGEAKLRYLSSFSSNGFEFFSDTITTMCKKVIVINDPYCAVADYILRKLSELAVARGYDVIVCPYTINPELIEHLIFPELNLAFVTQTKLYDCKIKYQKQIHSSRFLDMDALQQHKSRTSFNNRFVSYSLERARQLFEQASNCHAMLEKIYTPCVDFTKIDELFDGVKGSILSSRKQNI